jgi:hypothetical protein
LITTLLIFHALVAVALLGALTHQALAVWWPVPAGPRSFIGNFRGVRSVTYTNVIIALYVTEIIAGSFLYPSYRLSVRLVLEDLRMKAPTGIFEIKEHLAALGLGMLPAYWYYWRKPAAEHGRTQALLTAFLAVTVWYNFLVGHILNNLRGFGL